jgi:vancomycin resistance protein YoaR
MTAKKKTKKFTFSPRLVFRHWRLLFLVVSGVVIALMLIFTVYAFYYTNRYLPHTVIGGVSVGGLTKEGATQLIGAREDAFLGKTLKVQLEDKHWEIVPRDIGAQFSNDTAIASAWSQEKGGAWTHQLQQLLAAPFLKTTSEVDFTPITTDGEKKLQEALLRDIEVAYQEVSLAISSQSVTVVPGKAGKRLDRNEFEVQMYGAYKHGTTTIPIVLTDSQPKLTSEEVEAMRERTAAVVAQSWTVTLGTAKPVVLDSATVASWLTPGYAYGAAGEVTALEVEVKTDSVKKAIQSWANSINVAPVNAQLGVVSGGVSVVQEGQDGLKLNEDATLKTIQEKFANFSSGSSRTIAATVEVAHPVVSKDTLTSLGITQQIGTATTDFTGSPTNRKANIGLGQRKLNGTLVAPGATYSTLDNLGPITTEAGFLDELVIKVNRTVPEAGGGLCQVSTTLFRAVLNAGLPITARQNHSYRVSYYERGVGPGLDATIYDPNPDFRWKNDLSTSIYVQSSIKGDTITFDLYGTSDGRVATVGKPTILEETPAGDSIYVSTDTLYVGEQKQIEHPHPGAKTVAEYSVMRDGKEINHQTFRSTYKPWPAQYLVGTKPRPTE